MSKVYAHGIAEMRNGSLLNFNEGGPHAGKRCEGRVVFLTILATLLREMTLPERRLGIRNGHEPFPGVSEARACGRLPQSTS